MERCSPTSGVHYTNSGVVASGYSLTPYHDYLSYNHDYKISALASHLLKDPSSDWPAIPYKSMPQTEPIAGYEHEDAWNIDWLRVDDVHELHYQQYGKKDGKPGKHSIFSICFCCHSLNLGSNLPSRRPGRQCFQSQHCLFRSIGISSGSARPARLWSISP